MTNLDVFDTSKRIYELFTANTSVVKDVPIYPAGQVPADPSLLPAKFLVLETVFATAPRSWTHEGPGTHRVRVRACAHISQGMDVASKLLHDAHTELPITEFSIEPGLYIPPVDGIEEHTFTAVTIVAPQKAS